MSQPDYGSSGRYGIGTPQANPTVEPEFSILMPRTASLHAVRLTSLQEKTEDRLCEYLESISDYLERFDRLQLSAFGFACTASSYLLGQKTEDKILSRLDRSYDVFTATQAIDWALMKLNAKRILIAAPYPKPIRDAGYDYWTNAGYDIREILHIETTSSDTRSIYELQSQDAIAMLESSNLDDVDAVLLSGTGMPSLKALALDWPVPVVSSNLCLAARMMDGREPLGGIFPQGWRERLAQATVT